MNRLQETITKCDPGFLNPDARPGIGPAVSKAHTQWCDENPDATREERKVAYRETFEKVATKFPTYREIYA